MDRIIKNAAEILNESSMQFGTSGARGLVEVFTGEAALFLQQ